MNARAPQRAARASAKTPAGAGRARPPREQTYAWEGRDRSGRNVRGEMRAIGPAMVQSALRRQGVAVTRVRRRRAGRARRIGEKDIALFTRQLATMMKAGVPLLQSFDIVARGSDNPAAARLFTEIRSDVETGTALAQAFRRHPQHFDSLYCNLVHAGEQAGILDDLLDRLASYKEKMLAIKGKIKSALFYPAAVMIVAVIVVAVIMLFVVPAFKDVFSNFGADLPTPTLVVIGLSDFFVDNWLVILAVLGGSLFVVAQIWKRSPGLRVVADRVLLRLPVFGPVIEKATIARWLRTLSTMFAAGVPLVEALDSVGGASGNHVYLTASRAIQQDIASGTSLTAAMQNARVFPNMVLQMTSIGEEAGSLESMLAKAADIYEREVDESVEGLSSLLEPMIMVVLGVVIGGLVVAMYLPIFRLGQVV